MKLFLCGGGSGSQLEIAYKKIAKILQKDKPILYIPLAMDENKYDSCYNWFKNEISFFGAKDFEMIRSSLELSRKNFFDYSLVFIGGGNTYKLLRELHNNSNCEKIVEYLKKGGIVFGASAGAIIFGKDINSCLLEDKNLTNCQNFNGLNFLNDYSILCHLNKKNFKKNQKYLIDYSKKHKTIYLPEEDVIYITDNEIKLLGNKKYIIFSCGKSFVHNFANFKNDMNS